MIIRLPQHPHLAATVAAGPISHAPDGIPAIRYALIVKGAYLLALADTEGVRQLIPDPNPAHAALVIADDLASGRQSDMALGKRSCDIAVAGWLQAPAAGSAGMHGSIRVANLTWFTRATHTPIEPPSDPDAERHLFGWQPRTAPPRVLATAEDSEETTLPPDYTLEFENFHRRSPVPTPADHSPVFVAHTGRLGGAVPAGEKITIGQWVHGASEATVTWTLRTPQLLALTAVLRAWCGHGPDRDRHWKLVDRLELRCDTLLVFPAAQRAELLWRCDWDADLVPRKHWRKVQVVEGSA